MKYILLFLVFFVGTLFAEVNINTADVKMLSSLKGIGVKKAEAIVAYREAHGAFQSIEDLVKVKGIGSKVLEKVKADIVIK